MKPKAVVYVRVSSKEQDQEGYSIPAQKRYLNEYALSKGFEVVQIFEDAESAKAAGRTQFKLMIEFLRTNKKVEHLLVEKTDRLYRNLNDYNLLDQKDWPWLSIHFAKENDVMSKDAKSSQKLIQGIKVLMAKNYVDNLSEEVQKGLNQKVHQGMWPSCAPIGYTNNRTSHRIEPDNLTAPLIKRAFELAATGQYSLSKLKRTLFLEGLRGPRSKGELTKSQMQRILENPIYHGDFIWKGITHRGTHQPIVDKALFARAQARLRGAANGKLTKLNFAFSNTMTCGHCGCAITAEEKRKRSGLRYIYYHCTSGRGSCDGVTYVREEKIQNWVIEALRQIRLPEQVVEWTRQAFEESYAQEREYFEKQIRDLEFQYRTAARKTAAAYDDKLEGRIDSEFWAIQNERLNAESTRLEGQIASLRSAGSNYRQQGVELIDIARRSASLFAEMNPDEKRELVNLVLSNPRIENGSLRYDFKKPFSMFVGVTDLEKWRGGRDSNPRPPP